MNGYSLMARFRRLRMSWCFSNIEADLFYELLNICNDQRWAETFACRNDLLVATLGISEPTFRAARQRLQSAGLIEFTSGTSKRVPTVYRFMNGESIEERNSERNGENDLPQSLPQRPHEHSTGKETGKMIYPNNAKNEQNEENDLPQSLPQRARNAPKNNDLQTPKSKVKKSKEKRREELTNKNTPREELFSSQSAHAPIPLSPPPHAGKTSSVNVEDLWAELSRLPIARGLPRGFAELWWAKYESEGWVVTSAVGTKPILKPAYKVLEHWTNGRQCPNGKIWNETTNAAESQNGNGTNNGTTSKPAQKHTLPDEERTIEWSGVAYTYRRSDCDAQGFITNQNHEFFNEINMAQLMLGVGGSHNNQNGVYQ